MAARASLLLLLLGGCFSEPSYEGLRCDPTAPCPVSYRCTEGRCSLLVAADGGPMPVSMDASEVAKDGGEVADAGTPDASPEDAAAPDAERDSGAGVDAAEVDAGPPCAAAETCNGLDDDCNQAIDDGCPSGTVSLTPRLDTALTGWMPFGDTWMAEGCAPGDLTVGYYGHYTEFLIEVGEHCDTPSIVADTSVTPYRYSLLLTAAPSGLPRGGTDGTTFEGLCPSGMMVVGISGRSGSYIDHLSFSCASFELIELTQSGAPPTFAIREVLGSRMLVPLQAGGPGGVAFDLPCPTDLAAGPRLRGALGSITEYPLLVTTLGLSCASLEAGTE